MGAIDTSLKFPGVRDALRWAIGTCARNGYVSPCIARFTGGRTSSGLGLTMLEQHGQAAQIVGLVDQMPEPYQAAIWFSAGVLPQQMVERLADVLVPQVIRQLSTGAHNRRAVLMAIINTTGRGSGVSKAAIAQELQMRRADGGEWAHSVGSALEAFVMAAEDSLRRKMQDRGWIE